jgi:hypothetical protein
MSSVSKAENKPTKNNYHGKNLAASTEWAKDRK